MQVWLLTIAFFISLPAMSSDSFVVSLETGDEISVNVYPATFADSDKPVLIWFTEGYAERQPFKQLITQLNDEGYEFWQIDLLESYFIERTPTNVRGLQGEGVAEVLKVISSQKRDFVPISTGRMSLVLLRGLRLWQLSKQTTSHLDSLQQVITFFPNLFDAPHKAGDAPHLFPIVASSSLPLTIVQPAEGTYKWKLPEIVDALQTNHSQVTLAGIEGVRDWYFLRRDPSALEKQAGAAIPTQLAYWLKAGKIPEQTVFKPVAKLLEKEATVSFKGLASINSRSAANFSLKDVNGMEINLETKLGKVVLLNFWASWCPPCVKEIPSMNRLAESFDENQFEIVSVNFKESPQTIEAFLKKVKVDFPVLIDADGKVSSLYEIFAFPSSFLIDSKGVLRYSVNSAIEWDEPEVKKTIGSMIAE